MTAKTDLTGRIALVTGASRGIGQAIAQRLAADGALVAVHYGTDDVAAKQTVKAIEAAGGEAFPVRAELGVPGDVDSLFDGFTAGLAQRGLEPGLHILVNNAAYAVHDAIEETTPESFDRIFAVNTKAPFFLIKRALTLMTEHARIINISSGVTRIAMSDEIAYAMSKGALNVLGHTLANAVGVRGITVNTVAPGITDTGKLGFVLDNPQALAMTKRTTALDRIGQPADIADIVAFLASSDARWITGQVIDASGGLSLGPRMF